MILGTGTNAAYIEDASKVLRWGDNDGEKHEGRVLMDPESGAFGDNGCIDFIKTEWDKKLDENSLLPGSFTFEKYFAGKYLGELTRLVFETRLACLPSAKAFPNLKSLIRRFAKVSYRQM